MGGKKVQKLLFLKRVIKDPTEYQVSVYQIYINKKNYNHLYIFLSVADIVFILKDKPHPLFERKHNDLIYKPDIPLVIVSGYYYYTVNTTTIRTIHVVMYSRSSIQSGCIVVTLLPTVCLYHA